MSTLSEVETHGFFKELTEDSSKYLNEIEFKITEIYLPDNAKFTELQTYIHKVGFYTIYFIKVCKQLEMGVDFISNFSYKNKSAYNRIDHLIYNIENYIIRTQSVLDRLLQIINSVFYLKIDEEKVTHKLIAARLKNSTDSFRQMKIYLKELNDARNTIVHRHSYLERDIRILELLYSPNNIITEKQFEHYRVNKLKVYIKDKKSYYSKYNQDLFKHVLNSFDELLNEYRKQRDILTSPKIEQHKT